MEQKGARTIQKQETTFWLVLINVLQIKPNQRE
jgi:hypothetical protein